MYEINVSLNGNHYFATSKRSLGNRAKFLKVLAHFKKLFTEKEGFEISASYNQEVGEILDVNECLKESKLLNKTKS